MTIFFSGLLFLLKAFLLQLIVLSYLSTIEISHAWIQTSSSSSSLLISQNNKIRRIQNYNYPHTTNDYGSSMICLPCRRHHSSNININNGSNKNFPVVLQSTIIANNDDDARSQFGTKEYWDDLYEGRGEFPADEYTWYFGWGEYQKFVREYIPNKQSKILLPGIGNDPILLDLLQNGYNYLTATDYSESAIERQEDLLSYDTTLATDDVILRCMDARQMDDNWTDTFDAVLEKGALDAIYLSGDGNVELAAKELERIVKPGGKVISVSGVVPEELRREIFENWIWIRDGSDDLQAGCFVLQKPQHESIA